MKQYKADLHIHSVLSPCGGLEMSPRALMKRLKELNISWIAITDHNSLANCPAYAQVAIEHDVALTWGVEIQTAEEIHLLAYFDDLEAALEFDKVLYNALPNLVNDPDFFGDQVIIDANENIIRIEEKALSNSVLWDLEQTVQKIIDYQGICVPAHVDSDINSIISQLGFIPEKPAFPLLGVTSRMIESDFLRIHPELEHKAFLRASDAHYLNDLGCGSSLITVVEPTAAELMRAAMKLNERIIKI